MTQRESRWAVTWSRGIGERIGAERRKAGLTGEQLSERTGRLGYLVPRATIANIESGRREQVPVQEIAVLAAALSVPPTVLLFDVTDDAEILPGRMESGLMAAEWWSGNRAADLSAPERIEQQSGELPDVLVQQRQATRMETALMRALADWATQSALVKAGDDDPGVRLQYDNAVASVTNAASYLLAAQTAGATLSEFSVGLLQRVEENGLLPTQRRR